MVVVQKGAEDRKPPYPDWLQGNLGGLSYPVLIQTKHFACLSHAYPVTHFERQRIDSHTRGRSHSLPGNTETAAKRQDKHIHNARSAEPTLYQPKDKKRKENKLRILNLSIQDEIN